MAAEFAFYAFDLDGTLVDSRADLATATNRMRAELGLSPLPLATISAYIGEGARRLVERALDPTRRDRVGDALRRFFAHYGEVLLDETRAYAGVPELLAALGGRGAALAVVTNKPEGFSRTILEGLGLARYFRAVVGGDTLPERKPSPLPLRHAMAACGSSAPETLVVGDSRVDIETARAADVRVCAVTYGLSPKEALASLAPDYLADRPADVLEARP